MEFYKHTITTIEGLSGDYITTIKYSENYNLLMIGYETGLMEVYDLNTNTNVEHRAFVVTGSFEQVFPLDIYPMQILKACMYNDLDEMEALGTVSYTHLTLPTKA